MKISLPSVLDYHEAIEFVNQLSNIPDHPIYTLCFEDVTYVKPFGMLYAASGIRQFLKNRSTQKISISGLNSSDALMYASHVGFFRASGLDYGKAMGEASGSQTYVPICQMYVKDFYDGDQIDRKKLTDIAERLAKQLTRKNTGQLFTVASYAFREIIRNVIEHSESEAFWYCAQYTSGTVEIALLDEGIGLKASLSNNPFLKHMKTDRAALQYALLPGVSGKRFLGVEETGDPWQNSGYGLYMTYRLCNEGGSFFVCSGNEGMYRINQSSNRYIKLQHQGTALRLLINTGSLKNVTEMLDKYSAEGDKLSRQIVEGTIPVPSAVSKMISTNFEELEINLSVGDAVKHPKYSKGVVQKVENTPNGKIVTVKFNNRLERVQAHSLSKL